MEDATVCLALSVVSGLLLLAPPAHAEPAAARPADAAPAAKVRYSTTGTEIETLMDDPVAKAIVEKHIPGWTTNDQIEFARSMTLKVIQAYAAEDVTDERLAEIDAEFAKL
jgi:hypothetical protein